MKESEPLKFNVTDQTLRNVSRILSRTKDVEEWGSGLRRIAKAKQQPSIEVHPEWYC